MYVLFIHGPPAAGKYTIGKLLSERLELPLFHNHLVVDAITSLFPFGTEKFVELRASYWQQAFAAAAEAGTSFIFTFNPEATVRPETISDLVQAVETRGGRVVFVELACPEEVVADRLDSPSRREFGKLTDRELFRRLVADGSFDFPELPSPAVVVDTSALAAEAAADLVVRQLQPYVDAS